LSEQHENQAVDHLLGELEAAIMRLMWTQHTATVREVRDLLGAGGRPLAYTTVMTVMSRLAAKGLLARRLTGKTHIYQAAATQEEFLRAAAAKQVQDLIDEFGDLAVAQFLATVNDLSPKRRRQLERMARGEAP